MNEWGARRLVAAVIEQAIHDRRLAITLGLIDENFIPCGKLKSADAEILMSLRAFFFSGGLEIALDTAGFDIPIEAIRRKSIEEIKGRKKR